MSNVYSKKLTFMTVFGNSISVNAGIKVVFEDVRIGLYLPAEGEDLHYGSQGVAGAYKRTEGGA